MTVRPKIPILTIPVDFTLTRPIRYRIFMDDYPRLRKYLYECVENEQLSLQSDTDQFNTIFTTPDDMHTWVLESPEHGLGHLSNFTNEQYPEIDKVWSGKDYENEPESWYGVSGTLVVRES